MKRIETRRSRFGDWGYLIGDFQIAHNVVGRISYNQIRFGPERFYSQMTQNYAYAALEGAFEIDLSSIVKSQWEIPIYTRFTHVIAYLDPFIYNSIPDRL